MKTRVLYDRVRNPLISTSYIFIQAGLWLSFILGDIEMILCMSACQLVLLPSHNVYTVTSNWRTPSNSV